MARPQGLNDPAIGLLTDDDRDRRSKTGSDQLPGIEPSHHRHAWRLLFAAAPTQWEPACAGRLSQAPGNGQGFRGFDAPVMWLL
jgi:hypothetical protein